MITLEDLEKYRFSFEIQTRYSDMDMLGHANNAVYLTYLELARLEYFKEIYRQQWNEVALVLAHASMDFKRPILPYDQPVVHIRTTRLGNSSITMDNMITDGSGNRLFFTAAMVMVAINMKSGHPVPIPDGEKQKIIDYEPALS